MFLSRALFTLGSQFVAGYLLYIVMDFSNTDEVTAGPIVGILSATYVGCLAVGTLLAARIGQRDRVRTVMISTGVYAAALVIPLATPTVGGLVAFVLVAGMARGAFLSTGLALMIDVLPSGTNHARDLSVLGLATLLPLTVAPLMAGSLLAASGNRYSVLFIAALLTSVGSIPVIARISRPHPAAPGG